MNKHFQRVAVVVAQFVDQIGLFFKGIDDKSSPNIRRVLGAIVKKINS